MTTPTPTQQAEALWIRAHEHVRRGDFANAVRDLAACFKILQQLGDPRLPEVHRRWTEVHQLALEDAAHQKAAAAPKAEAQRPTLEAEAEAAANSGDLEKAIALLERAAAERPDNELVRERLAELRGARSRARELGANVAAEPVEEAIEEAVAIEDEAVVVEESVAVEQTVAVAVEATVAVEQRPAVVEAADDEEPVHEPVEKTAILYAFSEPAAPAAPVVEAAAPVVAAQPAPAVEASFVEASVEASVVVAEEPVVAAEPAAPVVEAAAPVVEAQQPVVEEQPVVLETAAVEAAAAENATETAAVEPGLDVDLTSGPVAVAPGPDADIHTAATLVPAAAAELQAAVGNAETDFGDIDLGGDVETGSRPAFARDDAPAVVVEMSEASIAVEPMIEAPAIPVAPIDDAFAGSVTEGPLNPAAAGDISSSLELATRAAVETSALEPAPAIVLEENAPSLELDAVAGAASSDAVVTTEAITAGAGVVDGDHLELSTETKEVSVGGPTATFAVEQELEAGPSVELAIEPAVEPVVEATPEPVVEPAVDAAVAPLMAAEDAPVGMPSLDVQIDMGAIVSADEADELPVSADELEVVGDDMQVEAIVTLPPQAAVAATATATATADELPDDPVALLETLLGRIQANRRAA